MNLMIVKHIFIFPTDMMRTNSFSSITAFWMRNVLMESHKWWSA